MKEFSVIYKILKALRNAMDRDEFDVAQFDPEILDVSENQRDRLLMMLQKAGYIEGLRVVQVDGMNVPKVLLKHSCPMITLKGLEYLEENSFMRRAADIAKGIVDVMK